MKFTVRIWWMFVVAGIVGAGQARADLISTSPYTLMVSESLAVLANPGNANVAQIAGLTTGHELAVERSEPYFLLTNTSGATLSEFQMTIGNTADHFTFADIVGVLSSAGVSLTSSLGSSNQDLTLNFSGLAPGDSIAFRVGLSPNSSEADPLVSYGHVFFNNESTGTGSSSMADSNSLVTVTFANPASTVTGVLGNQANVDAASPFTTAANCNCGTHGVGVTAFDLVGGDDSGFVAVATPEPDSLLLLGLGLLGLGSVAWRRRRSLQVLSR